MPVCRLPEQQVAAKIERHCEDGVVPGVGRGVGRGHVDGGRDECGEGEKDGRGLQGADVAGGRQRERRAGDLVCYCEDDGAGGGCRNDRQLLQQTGGEEAPFIKTPKIHLISNIYHLIICPYLSASLPLNAL